MRASERIIKAPDRQNPLCLSAFSPSLFCLVPPRIRQCFTVFDKARLLLRVFRGYTVYYLTDGALPAGYCFIKKNYLGKYRFLSEKDALINPYYVNPKYRGAGLGGKLIAAAIADSAASWVRLYAVVKEDNAPSIRTLEKLGFADVGYSQKSGWFHCLTKEPTHLRVFCITRENAEK